MLSQRQMLMKTFTSIANNNLRQTMLLGTLNMGTDRHAYSHHLSGFNGAFQCSIGKTTKQLNNGRVAHISKQRSSYFENENCAKLALSKSLNAIQATGETGIQLISRKLTNGSVPIGEYIPLYYVPTQEENEQPISFGKTIKYGSDNSLKEYKSYACAVIFEKTAEDPGFKLKTIYPMIDDQLELEQTPSNELRDKIRQSETYKTMTPSEKLKWLAETTRTKPWPKLDIYYSLQQGHQIGLTYENTTPATIIVNKNAIETSVIHTDNSLTRTNGSIAKQFVEERGLTDQIQCAQAALRLLDQKNSPLKDFTPIPMQQDAKIDRMVQIMLG